jgi:DNA-binding GntR family transcriptional regulator
MAERGRLEAVERQTAAEGVYLALKRDIITLRHPPGASLTEHSLAAHHGTSRVPVREACRRLQQEGLLVGRPYKGYSVTPISLKEIGDCFDLRELLECHALELTSRRASPAELADLAALAAVAYTFHDWDSYADFLERNFDFHIRLAALARSERLLNVLRDLLGAMQRFFFLGLDLGDFSAEMRGEHEELVALLQHGRTAAAIDCLRGQIRSSRDRILRALIDQRLDLPLE